MIPYGRHHVDQQDIDFVVEVLKSNWLTCGPAVEKFEEELSKAVEARYAVSCSNGTTALHLSMLALEIGIGDTVLVPAITFLASANAARYVGADVVFVDIDPATGLMTAETLEAAILTHKNKNLKAVVNVHLAGQCENLEDIYKISKKYNLYIIEDAAHAIGTVYIDQNKKKHPIGSNAFSDLTTFSFHPVKTIAMGEGGAITTNDLKITEKLRSLRSHGMIRNSALWEEVDQAVGPWYYEMQELGYNYRISDINCALGLAQLKKLQQSKLTRTGIVNNYDNVFKNTLYIHPIKKLGYADAAWHLYIVLIDFKKIETTRAELMNVLKNNHIGSQVHYIPVYKQPYYKERVGTIKLEGAELYYEQCLSLPLYIGLTQSEQQGIIKLLTEYAK